MKYSICLFALLFFSAPLFSQSKKEPANTKSIQWLTVEEVQAKMKKEPRHVYVDVYTDWCYWCKVMEKKTFSNAQVIDYMNANFYCIHFNAERKDTVLFNGKKYSLLEGSNINELAADWMNNQMSYPTSILFDANFTNKQPIPGYLDIPTFEMIIKYISGNKQKSIPFEKWKSEFKGEWGK